ncbi:MAG TPA: MOSC domain-containing protein [Methylocella sp.]|nr:MOSC domain-containing protein [Methylocella sp.]
MATLDFSPAPLLWVLEIHIRHSCTLHAKEGVMTVEGLASVAELRIHPVKGLRGNRQRVADIEPWGLVGDRRWMVIDATGRFLTQREHSHMALIGAYNAPTGITLTVPGMESIGVPYPTSDAERIDVVVWRDTVGAVAAGAGADAWISAALGLPCRLVYLADTNARPIDPAFATAGQTVNFADGFPVLLGSLGSLADLNARLAEPIPIDRFRPNIVVNGVEPWAEDGWRRIRIGDVLLRVVKPCERCIVTTIDPKTGLRPDKSEPLRTLGTFRRDRRGGVMFGQNLIPENAGRIATGDRVEVLERGPPNVMLMSEGETGLS